MNSKVLKFTAGCLVAMVVTTTLSACQNQTHNTKETIRIGFIGPLSGEAAEYGQNPERGARLAVKEINQNGGVDGRKLKLLTEDSVCNPDKGVTAIQKLVQTEQTKYLIGGMCSSVTLAMAPIIESNQIVAVSPVSTNYKISEAGDYIFRTVPSDAMQGKKGAKIAYQQGYRKAAVLFINNDYGAGLEKVFRQEFEKLGGRVLVSESHQDGDTDFKTQLIKIKSQNPDVVYLPTMTQGATIVKQTKELDLNVQIMGTETMQIQEFIDVAGSAAEGVVFTSFAEYIGNEAEQFKADYKNEYKEEKGIFSDYAYDAVYSIVKAMENCEDKMDTGCVKNELYKVNFTGATGEVSFDANGDPQNKSFSVFKVENGEFVEI